MRRLINCLILSLSIVAAFADDKEPKFQVGPASSYENKQTIQKLTIAAVPYETDEQAKPVFGKLNPYEHGILPVLVVMQNDSDKVLRLDRLKVEYVHRNNRIEATPAADVPYTRAPKRPNMGNPLPIPRRVGKNPLQKMEIEMRAFAAKMLPPGQSAHGFFYFQTGLSTDAQIYLTGVYEAATGDELFYFEIPLTSVK